MRANNKKNTLSECACYMCMHSLRANKRIGRSVRIHLKYLYAHSVDSL